MAKTYLRTLQTDPRNIRRASTRVAPGRAEGVRLGEPNGRARARELIEDPHEQKAIKVMYKMNDGGTSLMTIRDAQRGWGFDITQEMVHKSLARHGEQGAAI